MRGIGSAIGGGCRCRAGASSATRWDATAELQQELGQQATVEKTTDQNGLQAIKVTFEGGILFPTASIASTRRLRPTLYSLRRLARQNPDTNVQIYGFTDNTALSP